MDLYDKTIEFVDKAFGGKKPHFERTAYWIVRLLPHATETHKIAAYAHDIERGVMGERDKDYLDPDTLKQHSEDQIGITSLNAWCIPLQLVFYMHPRLPLEFPVEFEILSRRTA